MTTKSATERLKLVRAPHKPVPASGSKPGQERCARDGVRIHPTKRAWVHDRGEIGALASEAEAGWPKVT